MIKKKTVYNGTTRIGAVCNFTAENVVMYEKILNFHCARECIECEWCRCMFARTTRGAAIAGPFLTCK